MTTTTSRVGGTTFSAPSDREIRITRVFDAPRQSVFQALTDPGRVPSWYGPRGWTLPVCEIDSRTGGAWRLVCRGPDGTDLRLRGVYREVRPPERLVSTESFDGHPGESLNTLVLTEQDGRTTVTTTVRYPSKEARDAVLGSGMPVGASQTYGRLAEYLRVTA